MQEFMDTEEGKSNRSSGVDSMMGETPSKYNKKNKVKLPVGTEEEDYLREIVQPMKAKTKEELLGQSSSRKKKSNQSSSRDLFFRNLSKAEGVDRLRPNYENLVSGDS